jgi:hypothetical protein
MTRLLALAAAIILAAGTANAQETHPDAFHSPGFRIAFVTMSRESVVDGARALLSRSNAATDAVPNAPPRESCPLDGERALLSRCPQRKATP